MPNVKKQRRKKKTTSRLCRPEVFDLLDAVAKELANLLKGPGLRRQVREEARRLLIKAWFLVREGLEVGRAKAVLRDIDNILTGAKRDSMIRWLFCIGARQTLVDLDRLPKWPALGRVAWLKWCTMNMHRMEKMLERAERTFAQCQSPTVVQGDSGREDLELVWGEKEG